MKTHQMTGVTLSMKNQKGLLLFQDKKDFHLGYELYSKLVEPGLNEEIESIIFIPGDILNFLPFETLVTQKNNKE